MKRIVVIMLLGLAIGAGVVPGDRLMSLVRPRPSVLTIQQVQTLAELVTLRVQIVDVQETNVRGYVGGRRVVVALQGDILMATDLAQARLEEAKAGSAVVVLPQPRMISARLDHDKTRIVANEARGLWMIVPGDAGRTMAADRVYAAAQTRLAQAAADEKLIGQARKQAELVLSEFCRRLGVAVEIRWGR